MNMTRRMALTWAAASTLGCRAARRGRDAERLDSVFTAARRLDGLTSLAIHVGGKLVRQTFQNGLADERALTNVKSIAKSILSILMGIAIDRGHLGGIHDPLARYLPGRFAKPSAFAHLDIRHLLTMTADLVTDWRLVASSPNWVDYLLARGSTGTLGHFRYSTPASHLLSVLLTHATGLSTLAFAERHLFRPLGITNLRWQTDPQGYYRGGNDLHLGTGDLARIGHLMLDDGLYGGQRVVSAGWVRASTRKQVEITGDEADPVGRLALQGYGYLWWTARPGGEDAYLGWGNGRQYLLVLPRLRAVVTLTSHYNRQPSLSHHRGVVSLIDSIIELLARPSE
jgi:CubicO group peptidase (beta-lactamase class C family)